MSCNRKGEIFKIERYTISLEVEKHSEVATKRKQKDGCY